MNLDEVDVYSQTANTIACELVLVPSQQLPSVIIIYKYEQVIFLWMLL